MLKSMVYILKKKLKVRSVHEMAAAEADDTDDTVGDGGDNDAKGGT